MHELGVTFTVIKRVEEVARENNVKHICKVTLSLGEVSTVIPEQLIDCWNWAVNNKSEILSNCELVIEPIEAITYCSDCKKEYNTIKYGKICPYCASSHTWLKKGNEFIIKDVTAD
jgi:hydrogenase nickel incorporation protein HypA/HybF